jgi:hypothetical protein
LRDDGPIQFAVVGVVVGGDTGFSLRSMKKEQNYMRRHSMDFYFRDSSAFKKE